MTDICFIDRAAERQAEAPCLDGALPATVPELQEVVASLRRQHTAARMPPEIWHSRAPWSTYLYGEGKPAEAAVADGPVLDTTVVAKRQWAVILPFHGAAGSHRLAVVSQASPFYIRTYTPLPVRCICGIIYIILYIIYYIIYYYIILYVHHREDCVHKYIKRKHRSRSMLPGFPCAVSDPL